MFLVETGEGGTRPETQPGGAGGIKLEHPRPVIRSDIVILPSSSYALSISFPERRRVINGLMRGGVEIAMDS